MKHRLAACVARYGSRKTFAYSSGSHETLARQGDTVLNIRYTHPASLRHYRLDIIVPDNYTALILITFSKRLSPSARSPTLVIEIWIRVNYSIHSYL